MRGSRPLAGQDDSVVFPSSHGKAIAFLGKEALLARLTDLRSRRHREMVDRFFYLSRNRAYYYTNVYVLAEVLSSVRYRASALAASRLKEDLLASEIEVLHGSDSWDARTPTITPKEVFLTVARLFEERTKIEFSFQEATLVLEAARSDADFVFTYDGAVATLARSFGLDVLPYDESIRSNPNA